MINFLRNQTSNPTFPIGEPIRQWGTPTYEKVDCNDLGNLWNKSLTWLFRPFWGSDSLTIHYLLGWPFPAVSRSLSISQAEENHLNSPLSCILSTRPEADFFGLPLRKQLSWRVIFSGCFLSYGNNKRNWVDVPAILDSQRVEVLLSVTWGFKQVSKPLVYWCPTRVLQTRSFVLVVCTLL